MNFKSSWFPPQEFSTYHLHSESTSIKHSTTVSHLTSPSASTLVHLIYPQTLSQKPTALSHWSCNYVFVNPCPNSMSWTQNSTEEIKKSARNFFCSTFSLSPGAQQIFEGQKSKRIHQWEEISCIVSGEAPRSVSNKGRLKINFSHNFLPLSDIFMELQTCERESTIDFHFFHRLPKGNWRLFRHLALICSRLNGWRTLQRQRIEVTQYI
jgi:hypothetical protein